MCTSWGYNHLNHLGNHHHTVQVAREQVEYLHQWLEGKTAPPANASCSELWLLHVQVEYICASWWKEKHQQRKLQVRTSTVAIWSLMQQHATAATTTDQNRTSTGADRVTDVAINATCVRACSGIIVCLYTSCTDCCTSFHCRVPQNANIKSHSTTCFLYYICTDN